MNGLIGVSMISQPKGKSAIKQNKRDDFGKFKLHGMVIMPFLDYNTKLYTFPLTFSIFLAFWNINLKRRIMTCTK